MRFVASKKHPLGRPPEGMKDVERMLSDGRWIYDDGKPGIAFSYQDLRWFPWAMSGTDGCGGFHDDNCPQRRAMDYTCNRWGCANGTNMRKVK